MIISRFLYNIFLFLYAVGVRIIAWRSPKAILWINGRKNIFAKLNQWRNDIGEDKKIIWVHCASLGEFEQGRPVIEQLKETYPDYNILLTFFSPSGYEIRKHYPLADAVFYLPMDGKINVSKFINIIKPSLVIWVKYEYWFYYLSTLKKMRIPVLLVSAVFRESQSFFKWYGGFFKNILGCFDQIFVQNETSVKLLNTIFINRNVTLAGDTRFDRVLELLIKKNEKSQSIIDFCKGHRVIVAGSTWLEDEELLVHYANIHPHIKFIIAPHEVEINRINEVKNLFKNAVLFSTFHSENKESQILIIDNIGMLSQLYQLATITYIGGGFNQSGIHNILEAAVYSKPILFGPVYEKFAEATALINLQSAYSISNALELEEQLDFLFNNESQLVEAGKVNGNFVKEQAGATKKIIEYIYAKRLLTN